MWVSFANPKSVSFSTPMLSATISLLFVEFFAIINNGNWKLDNNVWAVDSHRILSLKEGIVCSDLSDWP